jgi:hypothetical protein
MEAKLKLVKISKQKGVRNVKTIRTRMEFKYTSYNIW